MANLILREISVSGYSGKGSPLTNAELDYNFINLNNAITSGYSGFTEHTESTSGAHGVSGTFVGTTDIQTLTNKTVETLKFTTNTSVPIHEAGQVYWDDADKTLAVQMGHENVTLSLGQEEYLRGFNNTGSPLLNGAVVYVNGVQGNRPTIALADASTEATNYAIGVVTHPIGTIGDDRYGYVTTVGIVRDINTSQWTPGVPLWLSEVAGELTQTRPVAPAHSVYIGIPLNSTQNGSIFVNPNIGNELNELHDVYYPTLPVDGNILRWNGVTSRWENAIASPTDINAIDGDIGVLDNRLIKTDGTSGRAIQDTGIEVDDDNNLIGFGAKKYYEPIYTIASGSTVDITNGNLQKLSLSAGAQITLTNPNTSNCVSILFLFIPNNHSYSWNPVSAITWLTFDGSPPTLSTAVGKVNLIPFIWEGTRWLGLTPHSEV